MESDSLELPELTHFIRIGRQDLIKGLSLITTGIDDSEHLPNVLFYIMSIYGFEFHQ
ncbi:MAG: hypothetical protein ACI845_003531 [Gammaproteobacteria bacterium]|jgi:hypothetical protein